MLAEIIGRRNWRIAEACGFAA